MVEQGDKTLLTTFPTATDNHEGQMMFLRLYSMFLPLLVFTVTVESIKIKVYWGDDNRKCAAAGVPPSGTLRVHRIWPVFFDKKTKLILRITSWIQHPKTIIGGILDDEYKGNVTENLSFGMYFGVIRATNLRRNENLFTNYVLVHENLFEPSLVPPGTGSDFSEMYYGAPFVLRIHIFELKETGEEKEISLYTIEKCGRDQRWIANEGYYRLDVDTGELLPIYYNPTKSDFYY
nr:unnamed protein product [Haemonchus contortus]